MPDGRNGDSGNGDADSKRGLWSAIRNFFDDEGETSLRAQIEEAIAEHEDEQANGDEQPAKGDLSPAELTMLRNLLHFSEHDADDVAIPRGEIIAIGADATWDELVAFLAERMPRFMIPRYIEVVDELQLHADHFREQLQRLQHPGVVHLRRAAVDGAQGAEELAAASEDGHGHVALQTVLERRVMPGEDRVLAGVVEGDRLPVLADLIADGGLQLQVSTGLEPEVERIVHRAGGPARFRHPGHRCEAHAGDLRHGLQYPGDRLHSLDPVNVGFDTAPYDGGFQFDTTLPEPLATTTGIKPASTTISANSFCQPASSSTTRI